MGKKFLIDTNIIIYYLKDELPEYSSEIIKEIFSDSFNISIITKIEFLGWNGFSEEEFEQASSFINIADILILNNDIGERAILIKRKRNMKLPDASIAATAIEGDYILVTRNEKDFSDIEGLEIYNPFKKEHKRTRVGLDVPK